MIAEAARRLLCRAGRHHVVRCAGAEDHRWSWDEARQRWTAVLVPLSARPAWRLDPVTPGRGEPTTPGSEEPVAPDPDPVTVDPEPVTGDGGLLCRCGSRKDEHLPVAEGGCTLCPCPGFTQTAREELDLHHAGLLHRVDEVLAAGDVDGYVGLLRETDRVGADQDVLAPCPPAGKNDLVGGRHRG